MNLKTLYSARKVPQITAIFWVIKLLTTAVGEATSDYSVNHFNSYLAVICGFIVFVFVLYMQLRTKKYVPWIYWLTVVMVAVFGTMAADTTHIALHVPYAVSTAAFAIILATVFYLWKRTEHTLSIHTINSLRRELYYWATVLAAFALGTAAGDFTATTLKLGYFTAGIIFTVVFLIPAIGYWLFKWNSVFSFWFAYIITRPIGASFADWTSKARSVGGLNYSDGPVAAVLFLVIVLLVGYLQVSHKDTQT